MTPVWLALSAVALVGLSAWAIFRGASQDGDEALARRLQRDSGDGEGNGPSIVTPRRHEASTPTARGVYTRPVGRG